MLVPARMGYNLGWVITYLPVLFTLVISYIPVIAPVVHIQPWFRARGGAVSSLDPEVVSSILR